MSNILKNKKAISIIEYSVLIVIILGALYLMKDYVARGVMGRMKQPTDTFSNGRQYDFQRTVECAYDDFLKKWYDRRCFEIGIQTRPCAIGDIKCERVVVGKCYPGTACNEMNKKAQ